jgi:formylmethanofuran dehydrogenase subunit E
MTKQLQQIEQLVKDWAQSHTTSFIINDPEITENAMEKTSGYFTWAIREGHANIDLKTLAERLNVFLDMSHHKRQPDGMACSKCNEFYQFAEPNQDNGNLICYACRGI